jgi:hypothetical protein
MKVLDGVSAGVEEVEDAYLQPKSRARAIAAGGLQQRGGGRTNAVVLDARILLRVAQM